MSGHVLMGHPVARLETGDDGIGVQLVCVGMCYMQKAITFPVQVLFLNLCDDTPVFLTETAYQ